MKREAYIFIPDTHGHFDQLSDTIEYHEQAGNLKSRRPWLLGDYVDRGPAVYETVEYLIQICTELGAIAITGNHDFVLNKVIDVTEPRRMEWIHRWARNYEEDTLASYGVEHVPTDSPLARADKLVEAMPEHHKQFFRQLPWMHETKQFIGVHAGLDPNTLWRKQRKDLLRKQEPPTRGPSQIFSHSFAGSEENNTKKTLVTGHASRFYPNISANRVMLDCGVDAGGPLASWVSDTGEVVLTD